MRIWPRRFANRGAFIAGGNCTGPIMNVNLVADRNGTGATAFVAPKRIAAGGERRSRSGSWDGESMRLW